MLTTPSYLLVLNMFGNDFSKDDSIVEDSFKKKLQSCHL